MFTSILLRINLNFIDEIDFLHLNRTFDRNKGICGTFLGHFSYFGFILKAHIILNSYNVNCNIKMQKNNL